MDMLYWLQILIPIHVCTCTCPLSANKVIYIPFDFTRQPLLLCWSCCAHVHVHFACSEACQCNPAVHAYSDIMLNTMYLVCHNGGTTHCIQYNITCMRGSLICLQGPCLPLSLLYGNITYLSALLPVYTYIKNVHVHVDYF